VTSPVAMETSVENRPFLLKKSNIFDFDLLLGKINDPVCNAI
jgi:hypothetical protein